jgi:small subunit ribosomal protein S11
MPKKEEIKEAEGTEEEVEEEIEKEAKEVEEESEENEAKATVKKKEKEIEAVLNIYTSFNNTIAHVTDASGRTIAKVSGGMVTKHSRLKANPTIAMFIAKRISENMKEKGIRSLYVRIRAKTGSTGPGPGANAIIKSLSREGFKIINILDTTRVPRGGPKKQGGRRGRRV